MKVLEPEEKVHVAWTLNQAIAGVLATAESFCSKHVRVAVEMCVVEKCATELRSFFTHSGIQTKIPKYSFTFAQKKKSLI